MLIFSFLFLLLFVAGIVATIFWVIILIEVIKREDFKDNETKYLWIALVVVLGFIGALLYRIVEKPKSKQEKANSSPQVAKPDSGEQTPLT